MPGVLLFDDPALTAVVNSGTGEEYADGPYRPYECASDYRRRIVLDGKRCRAIVR